MPRYPSDKSCSPLTSLYESWDDVDGTRREEPHSGVDGGRLGDPILVAGAGPCRGVVARELGLGRGASTSY